jgi:enoyl-CoA hydratase/carnithine racemase
LPPAPADWTDPSRTLEPFDLQKHKTVGKTEMNGHVEIIKQDGVGEVVLNRPAKLNAVTPAMADALRDRCADLDADKDIQVILLRGAGERAFCVGSDLNSLGDYATAWEYRSRVEYATCVRDVRKPVVAALHGWTLGGGAEMALAADVRFMGRSGKIGFPEVKRGWVGAGGASQMLPRLVGYGQAMKLLLSGEPIDAEQALRLGLVEQLVDDDRVLDEARAFCALLAGHSAIALQAVKAAVRMSMAAPLAAGLTYENEVSVLCFADGNHREGIEAFHGRRDAGQAS